jgi:putative sigma-54 modulation protein
MKIKLTAKHLKLTEPIRQYVREKVEKSQKFFDHIIWAEVFLSVEKRAHNAEIVIHAPGQTFRSLATASDLYSSIDLASDKIDAQLKKFKERLKDRHQAHTAKKELEAPVPPAQAIAVIKQTVSPITPAQAAEELDDSGLSFRLFQDKSSMQIHVIYRRSDDSFAVIQPVKKAK